MLPQALQEWLSGALDEEARLPLLLAMQSVLGSSEVPAGASADAVEQGGVRGSAVECAVRRMMAAHMRGAGGRRSAANLNKRRAPCCLLCSALHRTRAQRRAGAPLRGALLA